MTWTDRGTSEVVGFLLVFALVFAAFGVVQTAGFDAVSELRDREQVAGAERAFLALSTTLEDVQYDGVERTGTLRLGSGRLLVAAGPTVSVVENGTIRLVRTSALSYRSSGSRLTYASGGVFRSDGSSSVVLREPAMACRPAVDAAVVSVTTVPENATGIDSDGPVEVVARPRSTATWHPDRVTVNVSTSSHADAWARYLEGAGWTCTGPGKYGCVANETVVRRMTVDLRFVA